MLQEIPDIEEILSGKLYFLQCKILHVFSQPGSYNCGKKLKDILREKLRSLRSDVVVNH